VQAPRLRRVIRRWRNPPKQRYLGSGLAQSLLTHSTTGKARGFLRRRITHRTGKLLNVLNCVLHVQRASVLDPWPIPPLPSSSTGRPSVGASVLERAFRYLRRVFVLSFHCHFGECCWNSAIPCAHRPVDRSVPRKPRPVGRVKGHNIK